MIGANADASATKSAIVVVAMVENFMLNWIFNLGWMYNLYGLMDDGLADDLKYSTERVQRKVATESLVSAICDGSFFLSVFCCGVRDTVYVRFCHFRPFHPSSQSSRSKKLKKSTHPIFLIVLARLDASRLKLRGAQPAASQQTKSILSILDINFCDRRPPTTY